MRCLELVNRTIILAAWLAAAARREYSRFKEFMTWIKFGVLRSFTKTHVLIKYKSWKRLLLLTPVTIRPTYTSNMIFSR